MNALDHLERVLSITEQFKPQLTGIGLDWWSEASAFAADGREQLTMARQQEWRIVPARKLPRWAVAIIEHACDFGGPSRFMAAEWQHLAYHAAVAGKRQRAATYAAIAIALGASVQATCVHPYQS